MRQSDHRVTSERTGVRPYAALYNQSQCSGPVIDFNARALRACISGDESNQDEEYDGSQAHDAGWLVGTRSQAQNAGDGHSVSLRASRQTVTFQRFSGIQSTTWSDASPAAPKGRFGMPDEDTHYHRHQMSLSRKLLTAMFLATALPTLAPAQPTTATRAAAVDTSRARTRPARVVSSRDPWTVVYDHVTETMKVSDHRGRIQSSFAGASLIDGPVVRIPPDRPVEVRITNANPMLYRYDVTGPVVQERRARSCRSVLGTFAQAGLQFSAANIAGVQTKWTTDTLMRRVFSASDLARLGGTAVRGEPLSDADRARTISLVQERVESYESRAEAIGDFASTIDDSLARIAELSDATPSGTMLDGLAGTIRKFLPSANRSVDVPLSLRALEQEAQQPATVLMQLAATGDSDVRPLRIRFDSALTQIAASYRKLQAQLYQIEQYQLGVDQRWTLDPSADYRAVRIRMEATSGFAEIPRFKAGTVEALINPISRVACSLAPGLTIANAPRAFALRNDTIVSANKSDQRAAPALQLHLDIVDFPLPVGVLAGVGLGVNQRPDWYLGGSFRLTDIVRLNAGTLWQREEQLGSGRELGSIVPPAQRPAFDARTQKFAPAFFWGISLVP